MPIKVAACQIEADVDRPPSVDRLIAAVRQAAALGSQVVVLPELAACGYCFEDAAEARRAGETIDGPTVTALCALSAELQLTIVCGLPLLEADVLRNAAVLIDAGAVRGIYRKSHLWAREKQFFTPGDEAPLLVRTRHGTLGVLLCYDLEFPELARLAVEGGAELLAVPVNWPLMDRPAGERAIEVVKAQAVAAYYGAYVAVADRCGVERGTDWVGGSLIAAPTGYLLAGPATDPGSPARPGIVTADVDLATARDKALGAHNDRFLDRRTGMYH